MIETYRPRTRVIVILLLALSLLAIGLAKDAEGRHGLPTGMPAFVAPGD